MPGVDTSIYANQPNPVQNAAGMAGLVNTLNQNRLFQQQFQTNLGLSQIYKNAIDPNTGAIDMDKVRALSAQNPNITLGLPQAVQQSQAMQGQQLQIEQSKLDLAHKRIGIWSNVLSTLMDKPEVTNKDIMNAAGSLISSGAFSPQEVIRKITDPNDPLPPDPQGAKDWVQRHYVQGLGEQAQMQYLMGTPQVFSNGGQSMVISPSVGGGTRVLGIIQNTLAPAEAVKGVGYVGPGNTPMMTTTQQFANAMGLGAQAQPQGQQGAMPGRYPTQNGGQGIGGIGVQPPSASNPLGGIQVGLAPGVSEAAGEAAKGSADVLNSLRADVQGSAARIFTLNKALEGLQTAKTGPGSETVNNIKSFLLAQDPTGLSKLAIDPNKIKSYDEAQKYLTQYAMAQAGSLGQGTDEKLATALTGNASTHISNMAAQDVVKANIGLERMKQAEALAFDNSGQPPENFTKWSTQWNKNIDPRAFIVDQLTPQERVKMINGMKPTERRHFLDGLKTALQLQILSPADIAQNAGR